MACANWPCAPHTTSGVFHQKSVGSSPGLGTCVLKQDTASSIRTGRKAVGPVCCVIQVKKNTVHLPFALVSAGIVPQHLVNRYMVLCNFNITPHTV